MYKYRVYLRSKPGMWASYNGHVDVHAVTDQEAERAAINRLARGVFKDRGFGAWIVDKVERRSDHDNYS